jgi:hypothetical protein
MTAIEETGYWLNFAPEYCEEPSEDEAYNVREGETIPVHELYDNDPANDQGLSFIVQDIPDNNDNYHIIHANARAGKPLNYRLEEQGDEDFVELYYEGNLWKTAYQPDDEPFVNPQPDETFKTVYMSKHKKHKKVVVSRDDALLTPEEKVTTPAKSPQLARNNLRTGSS